jgi:hypothetical protein
MGAWQSQAIMRCLELEPQYATAAEERAGKREKYGNTSSEELAAEIAELEAKLGVPSTPPSEPATPHPQSQPRGPERRLLGPPPPPPEPERKIAEPPPAAPTYRSGQVHGDKHGLFTPKSKMDPSCPACTGRAWMELERRNLTFSGPTQNLGLQLPWRCHPPFMV